MIKPITDYTNRVRKLAVQAQIYSTIKRKTFVGLCGPNVIEYLNKIDYKRFRRITLYETDILVFNKIVQKLGKKYPTVTVYNESINSHLGRTKAFYDLDYCRSLLSYRTILTKISKIEEFSVTFAVRPISEEATLKLFRSYIGHDAFRHYSYKDGMQMMTISVSKRLWG